VVVVLSSVFFVDRLCLVGLILVSSDAILLPLQEAMPL